MRKVSGWWLLAYCLAGSVAVTAFAAIGLDVGRDTEGGTVLEYVLIPGMLMKGWLEILFTIIRASSNDYIILPDGTDFVLNVILFTLFSFLILRLIQITKEVK